MTKEIFKFYYSENKLTSINDSSLNGNFYLITRTNTNQKIKWYSPFKNEYIMIQSINFLNQLYKKYVIKQREQKLKKILNEL